MRNTYEIMLGATCDNTLVIAEFEIRDKLNGRREFSASFDEVRPFVASEGYLKECAENYVDSLDAESKLDLLERFNCKFSELEDELYERSSMEELVDISLFPESVTIPSEDDVIYFESSGCGQHDTRSSFRDNSHLLVSRKFFDALHATWDTYHLKEIPEEAIVEIQQLYNVEIQKVNRWKERWLKAWLTRLSANGDL